MQVCMDGWMHGWVGYMDEWLHRWMDACIENQAMFPSYHQKEGVILKKKKKKENGESKKHLGNWLCQLPGWAYRLQQSKPLALQWELQSHISASTMLGTQCDPKQRACRKGQKGSDAERQRQRQRQRSWTHTLLAVSPVPAELPVGSSNTSGVLLNVALNSQWPQRQKPGHLQWWLPWPVPGGRTPLRPSLWML